MTPRTARQSPAALIFDLDGLLLDTETIARDAFVKACHQVGWYRTDMDVYIRCIGRHGPEIEEILKDGYGQDFPWEEIGPLCQQLYHEFIDHQPADIKPGALELLKYATKKSLPCGIATSSHAPTADSKLTLSNLAGYFSVIVTGDDVKYSKPNPEPYLLAAERLEANAAQCWALEDSENGVRAAVSAGCTVFQVPDLVEPSRELRQLGHDVVSSLREVLTSLKEVKQWE